MQILPSQLQARACWTALGRRISAAKQLLWLLLVCSFAPVFAAAPASPGGAQLCEPRKPASDYDLEYWLRNMIESHRFTAAEASEAWASATLTARDKVDTAALTTLAAALAAWA